MQIIEASILDADLVGYIHSTAWKQAYNEMFSIEYLEEDTPKMRTNEFLEACNDNGIHYYMLYEDKIAVGIVKVIFKVNKVCEISSFYILDEYRNKGYGRQVIAYISDVLCQQCIYLWVLEDNVKARRFYENNGFVFTGKIREISRGKSYRQFQYVKKVIAVL